LDQLRIDQSKPNGVICPAESSGKEDNDFFFSSEGVDIQKVASKCDGESGKSSNQAYDLFFSIKGF